MSALQEKLQYGSATFPTSRIRYMKIVPSQPSGGANITLSATSSSSIQFQIPAMTIHYPSKCIIEYNIALNGIEDRRHVIFNDTLSVFSSLVYGDNVQHELVNIQNVDNYTKIVGRAMTCYKNVENNDATDLYSLANPSFIEGAAGAIGIPQGNIFRAQSYTPVAGTTILNVDGQQAAVAATRVIGTNRELSHIICNNMAVNNETSIKKYIKLSDIPNTYFKTNTPITFPFMTYLKMQSNLIPAVATSTANINGDGDSTPVINAVIEKLTLWLAVEENEDIVQSVMAKLNTGIPLTIPYTVVNNQPFAGGATSGNFTVQYGRDMGDTLKYIVWSVIENNAGINRYDMANYDGLKLESYQTSLNSRPLQNQRLSTAASELTDYLYNKEFLKDKTIGNMIGYYTSWIHVDSFTDPEDVNDNKNIKGIRLLGDILLGFDSTLAGENAKSVYCIPTFTRRYRITSMGIERL